MKKSLKELEGKNNVVLLREVDTAWQWSTLFSSSKLCTPCYIARYWRGQWTSIPVVWTWHMNIMIKIHPEVICLRIYEVLQSIGILKYIIINTVLVTRIQWDLPPKL